MNLFEIYKAKKLGASNESLMCTLLGRSLVNPHPGLARIKYDGSSDENWGKEPQGGTTSFYIKRPSDMEAFSQVTGDDIFCSACDVHLGIWEAGTMRVTSGYFNFLLGSVAGVSTVEDWRTWLASNPITVYYELAS